MMGTPKAFHSQFSLVQHTWKYGLFFNHISPVPIVNHSAMFPMEYEIAGMWGGGRNIRITVFLKSLKATW